LQREGERHCNEHWSILVVQVISEAGGQLLGVPILAGPEPIHFLVARDRAFEIHATSMTHEAKTVIRSSAPETAVTLTPRRLRPQ
jgi:hypothetical protein